VFLDYGRRAMSSAEGVEWGQHVTAMWGCYCKLNHRFHYIFIIFPKYIFLLINYNFQYNEKKILQIFRCIWCFCCFSCTCAKCKLLLMVKTLTNWETFCLIVGLIFITQVHKTYIIPYCRL